MASSFASTHMCALVTECSETNGQSFSFLGKSVSCVVLFSFSYFEENSRQNKTIRHKKTDMIYITRANIHRPESEVILIHMSRIKVT